MYDADHPEYNYDYTSRTKVRDDVYNSDKRHYMMGRTGFPKAPPESLTERQSAMYMMGWQSTRKFGEY